MTRSQPEPLAEPLLTVAEAAAVLGVSPRTIERLRKSGDLDHVEQSGPGPRIFYRQADVLAHIGRKERAVAEARDHEQPLPKATA